MDHFTPRINLLPNTLRHWHIPTRNVAGQTGSAKMTPAIVRFWTKVNKNGPLWNGTACWSWTGSLSNGYGSIHTGNRLTGAHKWYWEYLNGSVPEGLELDHLCRNPACVNPDHLEPVTRKENIRRGLQGVLKTHCVQGHEYTAENTMYRAINTSMRRFCKACNRERARLRRHDNELVRSTFIEQ